MIQAAAILQRKFRRLNRRVRNGGGAFASVRKSLPLLIAAAVILIAALLLHRTLRQFSYEEIVGSLRSIPHTNILLALAFAACSYVCLTFFDRLALIYVGRPLGYPYTALTSFVSLSLGHNIGFAALSSGAVRYRFYSRRGVRAGDVGRIVVFCGFTVALGLMTLGGTVVLLRADLAAEVSGLPRGAIVMVGLCSLAAVAGYLAIATFVRRGVRLGKWALDPPPLPLALGQVAAGTLNYVFVSACLYQAVAGTGDVEYFAIVTAYTIAAVMALLSHVPGGLGVIESVTLWLLPHAAVVGALIVFRVVYFLLPLCLGAPLFVAAELVMRRKNSGV